MNFKKQGFIQALGIAIYCSFIGLFFWKADEIFGKVDNFAGPVTFLMLFSTSALICAAIVFYKPYKLFVDGKKKEALSTVIYTAVWLLILLFVFMAVMFIL